MLGKSDYGYGDIDRSASEGGFREIQAVTDQFMGLLVEENMAEPKQMFFVVAMIRAMKVAMCIALSPSTADIQDILRSDTPIYLV